MDHDTQNSIPSQFEVEEFSLDLALCAYIDLSSGRPLHAIAAGSHHSRSLVLRGPDSASKGTRAKPRGGLFGL
jgi:hypothetical protein